MSGLARLAPLKGEEIDAAAADILFQADGALEP